MFADGRAAVSVWGSPTGDGFACHLCMNFEISTESRNKITATTKSDKSMRGGGKP